MKQLSPPIDQLGSGERGHGRLFFYRLFWGDGSGL